MRSRPGIAATVILLLTVPAAVGSSILGPDAPSVVAHVALGAAMISFAIAVFDFHLPRWLNVIGAGCGAALGSVFLLQAISLVVPNKDLYNLAFPVLGINGERPLLDSILVWFLGMLALASDGKARLVGLAVVPIAVGLELASYAAIPLGMEIPNLKAALLAPFVWLVLESLKGTSVEMPVAVRHGRAADASAG